jgi:thioredoxin reductase
MVDFSDLAGARCLILGGRMSAFEWAALMAEAAVARVHIVYRHDTPHFAPSDWSYLSTAMAEAVRVRGWYRRLGSGERKELERRAFLASRLRLEPWLAPRIDRSTIVCWPRCEVESYRETPAGAIEVTLSGGVRVTVDHVVLATGYQFDLRKVPYLAAAGLAEQIELLNGFPAVDEDFQTSVPDLYTTGRIACPAFGSFFGFVGGAGAAATIVVRRLVQDTRRHWGSRVRTRAHRSATRKEGVTHIPVSNDWPAVR